MIEVNVGGEVSKSGVRLDDDGRALDELVGSIRAATNIELIGLMTIAPPESDPEKVRPYFRRMATLAQEHGLPHLSMGMSDDFEVAIEEGATMVRIGRALFGDRS